MTPISNVDSPFLSGPPVGPAPFDSFYRRHVRAVYSYLLPRAADGDLAGDICAEVFAVAAIAPRCRREAGLGAERRWLLDLAGQALEAGGLPR